jgi:hypothetical protein
MFEVLSANNASENDIFDLLIEERSNASVYHICLL